MVDVFLSQALNNLVTLDKFLTSLSISIIGLPSACRKHTRKHTKYTVYTAVNIAGVFALDTRPCETNFFGRVTAINLYVDAVTRLIGH